MHSASRCGILRTVELLLKYGAKADVNSIDVRGETPLHHASYFGYTNIVRLLLENEADANMTEIHGNTPLHWASSYRRVETVNL